MKPRSFFVFKPDGIGDFFLATGVIRLLGREVGEKNLTIAVLPIMESVVRGQFPEARVINLPLRTRRVILNKFVANFLRCFSPWLTLLNTKVDLSISLRNMRDYFQTLLFFSVQSPRRILCANPLLQKDRPVRRWTEMGFQRLFHPEIIDYPQATDDGVPSELEAHRLLLCEALQREVAIKEIWPELHAVSLPPIDGIYWVCAPFSSSQEKDFPLSRWVDLFLALHLRGALPMLVLTGSPDQKNRLEEFHMLFAKASTDLGDKIKIILPETLQKFIDLLAGSKYVMTVDTAAAHAATALDCRTLILFSGKHQGMFAPWVRSDKQNWLLSNHSMDSQHWYSCHGTNDLLQILDPSVLTA